MILSGTPRADGNGSALSSERRIWPSGAAMPAKGPHAPDPLSNPRSRSAPATTDAADPVVVKVQCPVPVAASRDALNRGSPRLDQEKHSAKYVSGETAQLDVALARSLGPGYNPEETRAMAMPVPERIRPLRRVEYDRLVELGHFEGERIELLEGRLIEMTPIGPPHSSGVQKLTVLLVRALADRATVRIQCPFAALDTSEPEPDVAVVPLGDYDTEHPSEAYLIIEVAESSLLRDRGVKQRIYAASGVPEYWVVDVQRKCIEVYRDPRGQKYHSLETVPHTGSIAVGRFPDVVVRVRDVMR
jgi:Uma2 family endonuclease